MPVRVKVPTIMRSEVGGEPVVEGTGSTLRALLDDLDNRYPSTARLPASRRRSTIATRPR